MLGDWELMGLVEWDELFGGGELELCEGLLGAL